MKISKLRSFGAGALIAASFVAPMALASEIPVVPASVLTRKDTTTPKQSVPVQQTQPAQQQLVMNRDSILVIEPGVNQILPIAIDHLNRIVTPFADPVANTTSTATTKIQENVVYVATNGEMPVTLFITERGSEAQAISLTLVPQKIPPREIFLKMSEKMAQAYVASRPKAQRWERSQPYIETIRTLLRSLAIGEIPSGYAMSPASTKDPIPLCSMPGLAFDFLNGQRIEGHSLAVAVGVVKNTAHHPIEVQEAACGNWDVAAVAVWPNNLLEPGQASEIYVAYRVNREAGKVANKRPSLVGR